MTAPQQRASAYRTLQRNLSRLLYNLDPEGMGSTVWAPANEYDGLAARLISAIHGRGVDTGVEDVIRQVVPPADQNLVDAVANLWRASGLDRDGP